jgi:hypothetical protein
VQSLLNFKVKNVICHWFKCLERDLLFFTPVQTGYQWGEQLLGHRDKVSGTFSFNGRRLSETIGFFVFGFSRHCFNISPIIKCETV